MKKIFLVGCLFAGLALLCLGYFFSSGVFSRGKWLALYTALSAFWCGAGAWWLASRRNYKLGFWRGTGLGTLVALTSHLLVSLLIATSDTVFPTGTAGYRSFGSFVKESTFLFLISLLSMGWYSLPCAGLLGGLLGKLEHRFSSD